MKIHTLDVTEENIKELTKEELEDLEQRIDDHIFDLNLSDTYTSDIRNILDKLHNNRKIVIDRKKEME